MNIIRDHHASQSDISHIGGRKEGRKGGRRRTSNVAISTTHPRPARFGHSDQLGWFVAHLSKSPVDGHRFLFRKKWSILLGATSHASFASPLSFSVKKTFRRRLSWPPQLSEIGETWESGARSRCFAPFCLPLCTACTHP